MGEFGDIIRTVQTLREQVQPPSPDLLSQYQNERQRIKDIYNEVIDWHGTGRYQYSNIGEMVDILAGMVTSGLTPTEDRILPSRFDSISTSAVRSYALVYATVHLPEGESYQYQYHSSKFWFLKVAQNTFGKIFKKTPNEIADNDITSIAAGTSHDKTKKVVRGVDNWSRKFTKETVAPNRADEARSDIEGNYPILVGIRKVTVPYSRIGFHEKRYHKTIPYTDFTHIEVPLNHVAETEQFLREKGLTLPIIPIEFGELYSSEFPLKALVDGNPFLNKTTI